MRKRIAVLAGGDSGEYEVSINSANVVVEHLDKELYEPYLIVIKGRDWNHVTGEGGQIPVNRHDFTLETPDGTVAFDCAFLAIHGTPGENGILQGYFELLGIPYTTCDVATSALTFNKFFTLLTARELGMKTARSVLLREGKGFTVNEIVKTTGIPCFVKPNEGGSSVATTRVMSEEELMPAIDEAFKEDDGVLVEEFIPGREITCGVAVIDGKAVALPITEIISKKEFFDYEAKYHGAADEITPADIPSGIAEQCTSLSLRLYEAYHCRGLVRFDFIYNEKGMYFLELNTVPGLSEASIVPQQAEYAGIPLKDLFSATIEAALER
jgi:D-alanine-D-alanine ligase